ncbi:MAG: hypothetical protein HUU57_16255 [Bdellovibrio sp.]|nr:hypothetical protein [Bdellovibrio sp.]
MNLRLDNKNIRIRLNEKEWAKLQESGKVFLVFELGFARDLAVNLTLSDHNDCQMVGFEVHVHIDRESLQKPQKKKDPYWNYLNDKGIHWSLDVDIIPEEKR